MATFGLLASLVVLVSSGSAQAVSNSVALPPLQHPAIPLADMPNFDQVLTNTSGGVTVGCSNSTSVDFKSFDVNGGVTQNVSALETPRPFVCPSESVVGRDGTIYTFAQGDASTNYQWVVVAYRANARLWQYTPPCGPSANFGSLVLGANQNIYFMVHGLGGTGCNGSRVIGLAPVLQPGQTSPAVVMDLQGLASDKLAAYTNGLVLHNSDGVAYISYAGVPDQQGLVSAVSLATVGNNTFDVSLSGRVFLPLRPNPAQTITCYQPEQVSGTIAAYTPTGFQWNASLPACAQVAEVHPTPDGGVITSIIIPSAGVSGVTWAESILSFGPTGNQRWSYAVPLANNTTPYTGVTTAVDTNGNVAVLQQTSHGAYNQAGSYVVWPGVAFTLLSGGQGTTVTSFTISGDASTGGSYQLIGGNLPYLAANTLYLPLQWCPSSFCDSTTAALYPVTVMGLGMDYPRGAMLGAGGQPPVPLPLKYVALGDSFAAGEGAPPFIQGTDVHQDPKNLCHQSQNGYPQQLAADQQLNLSLQLTPLFSGFVACSGATTFDIAHANSQNHVIPQDNSLTAKVRVVTLSIGGNDAQFPKLAAECVFLDCTPDRQAFFNTLASINTRLTSAYHDVLNKAPNAKIYVIGYPQLFNSRQDCSQAPWMAALDAAVQLAKTPTPAGNAMKLVIIKAASDAHLTPNQITQIFSLTNRIEFNKNEQQMARDFVRDLNLKIQAMVSQLHDPRLVYVDPNMPGSPFAGNELCSAQPAFNGLNLIDPQQSFHPNASGVADYAQVITAYMSGKMGPQYALPSS